LLIAHGATNEGAVTGGTGSEEEDAGERGGAGIRR
jgi:hypothetical protein